MTSPTNHSAPRLSEVARHLVIPSGIVTTGWPAVEKKLRRMGVTFDSWQVGASRLILGKREDETFAATIGGVFLSIPRQVGKTYMVSSLVFALCLLIPNLTVVWTAHLLKTAGQTLRVWRNISKRKYVRPFVTQIRVGSGDWKVIFANGSTITLSARESDQGRGESEVDLVIFDEAQILSDKGVDALVPTANASKQVAGALVIYMGTPPKPTDGSEVFTRNRVAALSGSADDMLYIEFSADPKTDPKEWPAGYVDFAAVASANPSYPIHTPKVSILRMARQLSRESLRREGLGIWDVDGALAPSEIDWAKWDALGHTAAPLDGRVAYAVRFSADGSRVALAAALRPAVGVPHVELIKVEDMAAGTGWLVTWLSARWRNCSRITIDGKAGAGALVNALRVAKIPERIIHTPTVDEVISAHAMTAEAIRSAALTHSSQKQLDDAVRGAGRRTIGTAGGWGWKPLSPDVDVVPLDAVTLALHAVTTGKSGSGRTGSDSRRAVIL